MKQNSCLLSCLVFALLCNFSANSQVYRFKPLHYTTISYTGKEDTYSWHSNKIYDRSHRTYTFDVERKMVITPIEWSSVGSIDTVYTTSIERDERNKRLIFRAKPRDGHRWTAYSIQFGSDGTTPLYFQAGYNLKRDPSRDSMLNVYTDDLRNFPFAIVSNGMKEDTTLATGNHNAKIKALAETPFGNGNNRVEMRPGVILWTKGRGRHATVERFEVDSVSKINDPKLNGVLVTCHIPGDAEGIQYVIGYVYKNGLHEVHINRLRFNRVVTATILQGF